MSYTRDLITQVERLQTENERLREALEKIYRLYVQEEYHLTALKMAKVAKQALNIEPPASEVIEHLCDEIERLQQRIAELEEALAKIASYESMRFRLSPYEYGVLEQIVGIAEHALKGDK